MKWRNFAHRPGCAVEATVDLIDGKWKGVILFRPQAGSRRFGELQRGRGPSGTAILCAAG
jgi:DNA-binding HxlR family transcriptional regulator